MREQKYKLFIILAFAAPPLLSAQSANAQDANCSIDWGSTKHDGFDQGIWAKYEKAACGLGKKIKAISCFRDKAQQESMRSACEAKSGEQACNGLVAKGGKSYHQGSQNVNHPDAVACDFEKSGVKPQEATQKFAEIGEVGTRCYGKPDVVHIDNHGVYRDKNGCGGQ